MTSSAQGRHRVFVGDLQGCAAELDDLLALLGFDPDRHELWIVGDIVNRGPDSLGALRRVVDIGADSVLGNHDLHLIARWSGLREPRPGDTLDDVLEADDADRLVGWLRERPPMVVWDDLVLVHAGLHPQWDDLQRVARRTAASVDWSQDPLEHPDLSFMTTVRSCDATGNRPRDGGGADGEAVPWDEWYRGRRTVVFGHWSQRGLVDRRRGQARMIGLDTGCVWGGRLTAWIAEEDRFVSVPARRRYQDPD